MSSPVTDSGFAQKERKKTSNTQGSCLLELKNRILKIVFSNPHLEVKEELQ